jgi:hypothetical protein
MCMCTSGTDKHLCLPRPMEGGHVHAHVHVHVHMCMCMWNRQAPLPTATDGGGVIELLAIGLARHAVRSPQPATQHPNP